MEIPFPVYAAAGDIFRENSFCGMDFLVLGHFAPLPAVVPESARVFLLPWHVQLGHVPGLFSTSFIGVWRHPASIQPQKPGKMTIEYKNVDSK